MKELIIKKCDVTSGISWDELLDALNPVPWNDLDVVNWPEYNYRPQVQFRILYSDTAFLLQYQVQEKYIRAIASKDNAPVCRDSCVEFFISPDGNDLYYGFEFNCAGVCLLDVGTSRYDREFASPDLMNEIKRLPSLGRTAFQERKGDAEWNITLSIPYSCLFKHPGYHPKGQPAKANFFKCGDELTEPHYLSWNPIKAKNPDFHRPECFGKLLFE